MVDVYFLTYYSKAVPCYQHEWGLDLQGLVMKTKECSLSQLEMGQLELQVEGLLRTATFVMKINCLKRNYVIRFKKLNDFVLA